MKIKIDMTIEIDPDDWADEAADRDTEDVRLAFKDWLEDLIESTIDAEGRTIIDKRWNR